MAVRPAVIVALILPILLSPAPCVGEGYEPLRGVASVDGGNFTYLSLSLGLGDVAEYSFSSEGGARFDLLVMGSQHFHAYRACIEEELAGDIAYFTPWSKLDTHGGDWSFRVPAEGDYRFVIDNTNYPSAGAMPNGTVEVEYRLVIRHNPWTLSDIARSMGVVAIAAVAIILIDHASWKVLGIRKAEAAPLHYGGQKLRTVVRRRLVLRKRK